MFWVVQLAKKGWKNSKKLHFWSPAFNFLVLSFLEIYCLVLTMMTQDVVCFSAIISCCEKAGQWQQALTLVDTMLPRNLSPNLVTFNAAISSCEQQGMWQQALRLMKLMEDASLQADVISFNGLINSLETSQRWQQSLVIFDTLLMVDLQPSCITFNTVMSCCEKAGEWQQALQLLQLMSESTVAWDVISFNSAISSLVMRSGEIGVLLGRWWFDHLVVKFVFWPSHASEVTGCFGCESSARFVFYAFWPLWTFEDFPITSTNHRPHTLFT